MHFAFSSIHWIKTGPTVRPIKCLSIHAISIRDDRVERIELLFIHFVVPDEGSDMHHYPDERGCISHRNRFNRNRNKIEEKPTNNKYTNTI